MRTLAAILVIVFTFSEPVMGMGPIEQQALIGLPSPFAEMSRLDRESWKTECASVNRAFEFLYENLRDTTMQEMPVAITVPQGMLLMNDVQRRAWGEWARQLNNIFGYAFGAWRGTSNRETPLYLAPLLQVTDMSLFDQRIWQQQIRKINTELELYYERVRGL